MPKYLHIILFLTLANYCILPLSVEAQFINKRHVYVRGEKISLEFQSNAEKVIFDVGGWLPKRVKVVKGSANYSFDSSLLRCADYKIRAMPIQNGKSTNETVFFPLTIAPMSDPQRYPVWHWGFVPSQELTYWTQRGFNGFRFNSARAPLGENDATAGRLFSLLEEGARLGVDIGLYFHPLKRKGWTKRESARCLLPTGKRDPQKAYPLEPEVMEHTRKTVQSWMERFSEYPSFRHAQLSSEYVTPFCVNEPAKNLAEREIGIDLEKYLNQAFVHGKWGKLSLGRLPDSMKPEKGIIADDNNPTTLLSLKVAASFCDEKDRPDDFFAVSS